MNGPATLSGCRCAVPYLPLQQLPVPVPSTSRSRSRFDARLEAPRRQYDQGHGLQTARVQHRKRARLDLDGSRRDFSLFSLFPAKGNKLQATARSSEPGTVASLTTADKSRESESPEVKEEAKASSIPESSIHALTEEIVMPTSADGTTQDEINTLLAYPTLYDPIRKPRNPLVLCHGLYGFDTWGLEMLPALRIHYWADVLAVLKGVIGIDPIITGVPGTGHITERAKKLHETLKKDVKGKDINILAHSMGGLDARYLLTHIRPTEYTPLSLTTLATPHRGSQFMSWCRANIGIGDIAKAAAEASQLPTSSASSSRSETASLLDDSKLPYSLKTPILSRKQQEERDAAAAKQAEIKDQDAGTKMAEQAGKASSREEKKKALQQSVINFPGLNYSLGTSLASYLLDLLDSPAYGCLTPDYLNNTFNPSTPDRPDVRYFSVAANAPKLAITHPLWLPKLILDKAEELEKHKDQQQGRSRPEDWQWGNDGLVPIYSAKWGEYLGCMENTDHWSMRGGSGLATDFSAKKVSAAASKQAEVATDKVKEVTSSVLPDSVNEAASTATSTAGEKLSFGWQDVNRLVGSSIAQRDGPASPSNPSTQKDSKGNASGAGLWPFASSSEGEQDTKKLASQATSNSATKSLSGLAGIANWIVKRIPLPLGNGQKKLTSFINPSFPFDDTVDDNTKAQGGTQASSRERSLSDTARLLFGSGGGSASSSNSPNGSSDKKGKKFNHERFYVALCRKLYDEGL